MTGILGGSGAGKNKLIECPLWQLIVGWRNRFSKIIDFTVMVLAVITITALDGVSTVAVDNNPEIPFGVMVWPLEDEIQNMFEQLFSYAVTP